MKDIYEEKCKKIYWLRPYFGRRNKAKVNSTVLVVVAFLFVYLFLFAARRLDHVSLQLNSHKFS